MDTAKKIGTADTAVDSQKRSRILLVDEHAVTAEIERNYLSSVGFEVSLATDTEQAMSKIAAESFDLIMIDTNFRGDKGVETLRVLKARSSNPAVKSIISGLSFPPPLKQKARDAGADEIFIKPVPRPQVLKELKKLLANEVRVNERISHALNLVLKWNEAVQNCTTLDLSAEGVHLSALKGSQRPEIGAMVEMDIQLTQSESLSKVQGEVMRHTAEGFGVRFQKLKKTDQKKLDKYILRHSLEHAASHFYL
jgi:CheY-like chemotaxis protein